MNTTEVCIQQSCMAGQNVTNHPIGTEYYIWQKLADGDFLRWTLYDTRLYGGGTALARYFVTRCKHRGPSYDGYEMIAKYDSTNIGTVGDFEIKTILSRSASASGGCRFQLVSGVPVNKVRVVALFQSAGGIRGSLIVQQRDSGLNLVPFTGDVLMRYDQNQEVGLGDWGRTYSDWIDVDPSADYIDVVNDGFNGDADTAQIVGIQLLNTAVERDPGDTVTIGTATRPRGLMWAGPGGDATCINGANDTPFGSATSEEMASYWNNTDSFADANGIGGDSHRGMGSATAGATKIYTQSSSGDRTLWADESTLPMTADTIGKTAVADSIVFVMNMNTFLTNSGSTDVGDAYIEYVFSPTGPSWNHNITLGVGMYLFGWFVGTMRLPPNVDRVYFPGDTNYAIPDDGSVIESAVKTNQIYAWSTQDDLLWILTNHDPSYSVVSGGRPRIFRRQLGHRARIVSGGGTATAVFELPWGAANRFGLLLDADPAEPISFNGVAGVTSAATGDADYPAGSVIYVTATANAGVWAANGTVSTMLFTDYSRGDVTAYINQYQTGSSPGYAKTTSDRIFARSTLWVGKRSKFLENSTLTGQDRRQVRWAASGLPYNG